MRGRERGRYRRMEKRGRGAYMREWKENNRMRGRYGRMEKRGRGTDMGEWKRE